jgi:hypothetical protein
MMAWQPRPLYDSDEHQPALGPGLSRPLPTETTRPYRLQVKIPSMRPMTITIPAPSRGRAIRYCQNRWPGCTAETIE